MIDGMRFQQNKTLFAWVLVLLVVGGGYLVYFRMLSRVSPAEKIGGFERVTIPSRITSESEPDIEFLSQDGPKLLTEVYSVPLPNNKMFYLGMPVALPINEYSYTSRNCGSGGCDYYAYFGDTYVPGNPTHLTPITGFDSYSLSLDCGTGKADFYTGENEYVFGFPRVDKSNRVVRVYEHMTAYLGSENVYLIADDGTPKLIASYDNWCDDSTIPATSTSVIYRDSSYPPEMTAF